jgi:predicted acyltransferase
LTGPDQRWAPLDAFRGLAIAGMLLVNDPGDPAHVYAPLRHAEWHGWTPADLVFPFFLFAVGVAVVLSAERLRHSVSTGRLVAKAVRRSVVLLALGLLLAGAARVGYAWPRSGGFGAAALALTVLGLRAPPASARRDLTLAAAWFVVAAFFGGLFDGAIVRLPGVLQRIAACYLAAYLLVLLAPARALPWVIAALLLGYWGLLALVTVSGQVPGSIDSPGANVASHVDRALFGARILIPGVRDPEGLLSTMGALATVLFGVQAGHLLGGAAPLAERVLRLLLRGVALVAAGYAWGWLLPINKPLWTSSFAVLTAGQACCALALCAYAIDARGWRRWAAPLVTLGVNAIAVYVASHAVAGALSMIEVADAGGEKRLPVDVWAYRLAFAYWLDLEAASFAYALAWLLVWWAILRVAQGLGWTFKA